MKYYPNLTKDHEEYVLFDVQKDKIKRDWHDVPVIYPSIKDAQVKSDVNDIIVNVKDLHLHQQDELIRYWNQNLKYIKK
tara:strand:- start:34826 stop:35062 length:237 start_codon:yes stop_codon:yes gene_type:complete